MISFKGRIPELYLFIFLIIMGISVEVLAPPPGGGPPQAVTVQISGVGTVTNIKPDGSYTIESGSINCTRVTPRSPPTGKCSTDVPYGMNIILKATSTLAGNVVNWPKGCASRPEVHFQRSATFTVPSSCTTSVTGPELISISFAAPYVGQKCRMTYRCINSNGNISGPQYREYRIQQDSFTCVPQQAGDVQACSNACLSIGTPNASETYGSCNWDIVN